MAPHINPLGLPVLDIGRDVNGRFRPGNKGGPGNPFARKVASLRKVLLDSVSEQDIKDITQILKLKALQGDKAAIKLILQYCVGKPEPVKDPDRMDIDEWDRLEQMSVSEDEYEKTTDSIPACLACHDAETAWPCNAQEGPLAGSIRSIHTELHSAGQHPVAPNPLEPSAAPETQPVSRSNPNETNPTPQIRPQSANRSPKSSDRREPASASKSERRSAAQPPSPNEQNDEEQLRTIELLLRAWKPTEGTEQPPTG